MDMLNKLGLTFLPLPQLPKKFTWFLGFKRIAAKIVLQKALD
jgi:hypothetical protein